MNTTYEPLMPTSSSSSPAADASCPSDCRGSVTFMLPPQDWSFREIAMHFLSQPVALIEPGAISRWMPPSTVVVSESVALHVFAYSVRMPDTFIVLPGNGICVRGKPSHASVFIVKVQVPPVISTVRALAANSTGSPSKCARMFANIRASMTNLPPESTDAAIFRCIADSMLFAVTVMLPSSSFASMRKHRSSSTTLRRDMSGSMDFVISCMILRFVFALINTPFRRNRKTRPSRGGCGVFGSGVV